MRAPVEFVVTRHRLSHREEGPAKMARHTGLHTSSVSRALHRLREKGFGTDEQLLAHLRRLPERPHHKELHFHVPNPDQFIAALELDHLLSGEDAAVHDGLDLIPEHHLLYVPEGAWEEVARVARAVVAKVAPRSAANLTVREQDPWLCSDDTGRFVERGQRLLDYEESNHVQLARSLERLG